MPDIVLPSRWNYSKDIGESSLENPMPWDIVPTATFDKMNLVKPYLSDLLKHSNERVATNQDFAYVREDIEEYRKLQADKTVSLNLKLRLAEKDEADARRKAREKELLARPEPNEKIYELTLKQVDLPGLPPPVQKTNSVAAAELKSSGTNLLVSAKSTSAPTAEPDDADSEEKAPTVDVNLNEAEQILLDYLTLWKKQNPLLANQGDVGH
ncbi:MAG: carboxy terminal-processing peptidase [Verrucomicrobiota bacterium]